MNQELRNRFFTTHYDEINALCHRATYRICQIYGWAMRHDIHGYVMEGIVRGLPSEEQLLAEVRKATEAFEEAKGAEAAE